MRVRSPSSATSMSTDHRRRFPPTLQPGTEIMVAHDEVRVGGLRRQHRAGLEALGRRSRSPPTSATTSSATGCGRSSARQRRLADANPAARRFSVGITHPDRRAHVLHHPRPYRELSLAEVHAALDIERAERWHRTAGRRVPDGRLSADYPASVRSGPEASDRGGARYRLADRWLELRRTARNVSAGSRTRHHLLMNEVELTTLFEVPDGRGRDDGCRPHDAQGRHRRRQARAARRVRHCGAAA